MPLSHVSGTQSQHDKGVQRVHWAFELNKLVKVPDSSDYIWTLWPSSLVLMGPAGSPFIFCGLSEIYLLFVLCQHILLLDQNESNLDSSFDRCLNFLFRSKWTTRVAQICVSRVLAFVVVNSPQIPAFEKHIFNCVSLYNSCLQWCFFHSFIPDRGSTV